MKCNHLIRRTGIVLVVLLAGQLFHAPAARAVDKLVDTILYHHSDDPAAIYRWSEGSILDLDGAGEMMMLVTAFGYGGHDDSEASILEARSSNYGLTWTPEQDLALFQENIGQSNIQSPSLLRLDENELLCFFMVKDEALLDMHTWMKRSTDNGATWDAPQALPYTDYGGLYANKDYGGLSSDRAYRTSSGRIILPSWVSTDRLSSTHAFCHYSDDGGTSWNQTDLITTPAGSSGRPTDPAAEEPMIVELGSGQLMMFMRTYLKSIYVSYSDDDGTTWSTPQSSNIPSPGAMPTLKRMPNDDLLLIWNWAETEDIDGPWPRNHVSAAVSTDNGHTFSSLRHLDGSDEFSGKMTMANVSFADGNAIVTYSKSMSMANAYNWCQQVMPLEWFYEGDTSVAYTLPAPPLRGDANGDGFVGGDDLDIIRANWGQSAAPWAITYDRYWNASFVPEEHDPSWEFRGETEYRQWVRTGPEAYLNLDTPATYGDKTQPGAYHDYTINNRPDEFDASQPLTVDFKVRINGKSDPPDQNDPVNSLAVYSPDGEGGCLAYILWLGEGYAAGYSLDTSVWHDYRLVIDPGENASLFIDGETTPVAQLAPNLIDTLDWNGIRWGDISDSRAGNADWQFVGWAAGLWTPEILAGDLDGDGFVGGDDLDLVRANWGRGTPPTPNSIPEPASLLLMLTGCFAWLFGRIRG